jgi:hypothetical protein
MKLSSPRGALQSASTQCPLYPQKRTSLQMWHRGWQPSAAKSIATTMGHIDDGIRLSRYSFPRGGIKKHQLLFRHDDPACTHPRRGVTKEA